MATAKYPAPVINVHGHVVRLVLVAPGEKTCTRCGETSGGDYCVRCGTDRTGTRQTTMVATVSYLHPDEFRIEQ